MSQDLVSIRQLMDNSGVRFGTSGIRGLVSAMTPELCFYYTSAFLKILPPGNIKRVAIGIDLRPSSPLIASACAAAVRHSGFDVDFCGCLPTPALAYYAQEQGIPAVMVTGSHIPFDRNGIKFYGLSGEITKGDEAAIADAMVQSLDQTPGHSLPDISLEARNQYLNRYTAFFPENCLKGMRIGFYEHSSAARDVLRNILESLGAEVISLGRTDCFVPIDTEAVSEEDIQLARKWAAEIGFDAIVSTDGDADRPLIGDEAGNWIRGDVVGILTSEYLGASSVVTPVSSNTSLERCGKFPATLRTRIGSPYVIEGMRSFLDQDNSGPVVGFEANGGYLLGSAVVIGSRHLSPLMTRDAVLPILSVIAMSKKLECSISMLLNHLPARFTGSARLQSFPSEKSLELLEKLSLSKSVVEQVLGELSGRPVQFDRTDGLRITFLNGEVIHLRPSGNAPELRCYAEATDQLRANELAQRSLEIVVKLR